MKLSYKTVKIIMETIIDRSEAKVGSVKHKPFNNRMILSSPIEFISKISEQGNLSISEISNIINYDLLQKDLEHFSSIFIPVSPRHLSSGIFP